MMGWLEFTIWSLVISAVLVYLWFILYRVPPDDEWDRITLTPEQVEDIRIRRQRRRSG